MAHTVVIDTETTGFIPGTDRVLQIGALVLADEPEDDRCYRTYLNPGLSHLPAFHIHRITPAMVQSAPSFAEAAPSLYDLIDGNQVVGHNLVFDLGMLNGECRVAGLREVRPAKTVCTLELARRVLSGLPNHRLMTCCRLLGIPLHGAHDALVDATATAALFRRLNTMSLDSTSEQTPGLPADAWVGKLRTSA